MDALAVERYRFLLAAIGAGLIVAVAAATLLARRPPPPELSEDPVPDAAARRQALPHVMLLLVAVASATGLVLLMPAAMVMAYFPGWQVTALVLVALALLAAPLVYAWRSRPF